MFTQSLVKERDYRSSTTVGDVERMRSGPRFAHFMYWTSTGSGAYAGLTYHGFWYFPEPENFQPGDKFVWSGWIDEAD